MSFILQKLVPVPVSVPINFKKLLPVPMPEYRTSAGASARLFWKVCISAGAGGCVFRNLCAGASARVS